MKITCHYCRNKIEYSESVVSKYNTYKMICKECSRNEYLASLVPGKTEHWKDAAERLASNK